MSKSIKLKDNNYWDSTGITHNRGLLSTILETMSSNISTNTTNITNNTNNIAKCLKFNGYFNGTSKDFDDLLDTGIYQYSGYNGRYRDNPIPYYNYGIVVVFNANNQYNIQLIFDFQATRVYLRKCTEGRQYGNFIQLH